MKLGILVNTDRHAGHLSGITAAAVSLGHEVTIFIMDEGVKLLDDPSIAGLSSMRGVSMTFCDMSTRRYSIMKDKLPGVITSGSQYHNAVMNHESDRVIVL